MSALSEIAELSGQKSVTMPEKASFSQKCNRFSQYLKEKGSFGDLSLGMTCNTEPNGMYWFYLFVASFFCFFKKEIEFCFACYVPEF